MMYDNLEPKEKLTYALGLLKGYRSCVGEDYIGSPLALDEACDVISEVIDNYYMTKKY